MSDHAFKLAVCQIRTELDKKLTMDKAERMVCEAAGNGANVVVLPEMYNCPYSKKYFQAFADAENGGRVERMSAWAKENGKEEEVNAMKVPVVIIKKVVKAAETAQDEA